MKTGFEQLRERLLEEQMQPFQQRVIEERTELERKRLALESFLAGPVFKSLPTAEQERMAKQFYHMTEYSLVLRDRINAFSDAP
jgi:hypothetical protein